MVGQQGSGGGKVLRVQIRKQLVRCYGTEEGKKTHTVEHPCVMLDLGTGAPSDFLHAVLPRHHSSVQTNNIYCLVYRTH